MSVRLLQQLTRHQEWLNLRVNNLTVDGSFNYVDPSGGFGSSFTDISVSDQIKRTIGAATQLSSITSAVTIDTPSGIITTVDMTASPIIANASETFTVNNSSVLNSSVVIACLSGHYGTLSGIPVLSVNQTVAGSFKIIISNAHATDDLTGHLTINYTIIDSI